MKLKDTYTDNDFDIFLRTFKLRDKFLSFLNQYYQKQVISKYGWEDYIQKNYKIDLKDRQDKSFVWFNDLEIKPRQVYDEPETWDWDTECFFEKSRELLVKIFHYIDVDYEDEYDDLDNEELYEQLCLLNKNVYSNYPCVTSTDVKDILDWGSKKFDLSKDEIKKIKYDYEKVLSNYDDNYIIINEDRTFEFIKFENLKEVFKEFVNQNQSLLKEITNNFDFGQKYDFERVFDLSNKRTR